MNILLDILFSKSSPIYEELLEKGGLIIVLGLDLHKNVIIALFKLVEIVIVSKN